MSKINKTKIAEFINNTLLYSLLFIVLVIMIILISSYFEIEKEDYATYKEESKFEVVFDYSNTNMEYAIIKDKDTNELWGKFRNKQTSNAESKEQSEQVIKLLSKEGEPVYEVTEEDIEVDRYTDCLIFRDTKHDMAYILIGYTLNYYD